LLDLAAMAQVVIAELLGQEPLYIASDVSCTT